MPHAALGDDLVGKFAHLVGSPPEDRDLYAAVAIEVDVHGFDRQVVVIVRRPEEALGLHATARPPNGARAAGGCAAGSSTCRDPPAG